MDELTHSVEIIINGNYQHGPKQHVRIQMSGDGGIDHMIEAFRAAMMAAGFGSRVAGSVDCARGDEQGVQIGD